jgi:hypothetical protein
MTEEIPNTPEVNDLRKSMASATVMLNATARANPGDNQAQAYYYGNLGDSIERRVGDGYGMLGGGNDYWQGTYGVGGSWPANGYGNYFGAGLLNGDGRMFSGAHGGGGHGGGFQYLKRLSTHSAFNHNIIAACMSAYHGYGVVRNIIDLYADFASEGLEIHHPDKSVENFYRAWFKKIGGKERIHSMFANLFMGGQVFVHRRWATLSNKEKNQMKRAEATEAVGDTLIARGKKKDTVISAEAYSFLAAYLMGKDVAEPENLDKVTADAPSPRNEEPPEPQGTKIPWGYTYLNPLQMEVRGKKIRGKHYWIMAVDKKDSMDIAVGS